MELCSWNAHLLVHVHEKWGLGDMTQLTCLYNGANGIWASLCEEGAALGHACSTLTIMNLIRIGNTKVLERYNCTELRDSAKRVTEITVGQRPHHKKPVYGERALDLTFDFSGIAGGQVASLTFDFDIADFFGQQAPIRISTLSSEKMIVDRLVDLFGENDLFAEDIAIAMKATMENDLRQNRKEDYMSHAGLALLYARSGGKLTAEMSAIVVQEEQSKGFQQTLINAVRDIWDEWDLTEEGEQNDEKLKFESFYNGFMAPYFGCFSCEDTQKGLKAIDLDKNGRVDWGEFLVYIKWALRAFPDIADCDELLAITFKKGLIPVMANVALGRSDQGHKKVSKAAPKKTRTPRKKVAMVAPLQHKLNQPSTITTMLVAQASDNIKQILTGITYNDLESEPRKIIKFGHWDSADQFCRNILAYVEEQFEETVYNMDNKPWFNSDRLNKELDFSTLPYFIDGKVRLTQSMAIVRYLGRKHDLYGNSIIESSTIDMLLDQASDIKQNLFAIGYNPNDPNFVSPFDSHSEH